MKIVQKKKKEEEESSILENDCIESEIVCKKLHESNIMKEKPLEIKKYNFWG